MVIGRTLECIASYIAADNNLSKAQKIAPRFFFKKLRTPYYEAGIESKLRIVFEKHNGNLYAIFAGNHDQVKRFLAQN